MAATSRTLTDEVTAEDLRNAMPRVLDGWAARILDAATAEDIDETLALIRETLLRGQT